MVELGVKRKLNSPSAPRADIKILCPVNGDHGVFLGRWGDFWGPPTPFLSSFTTPTALRQELEELRGQSRRLEEGGEQEDEAVPSAA